MYRRITNRQVGYNLIGCWINRRDSTTALVHYIDPLVLSVIPHICSSGTGRDGRNDLLILGTDYSHFTGSSANENVLACRIICSANNTLSTFDCIAVNFLAFRKLNLCHLWIRGTTRSCNQLISLFIIGQTCYLIETIQFNGTDRFFLIDVQDGNLTLSSTNIGKIVLVVDDNTLCLRDDLL